MVRAKISAMRLLAAVLLAAMTGLSLSAQDFERLEVAVEAYSRAIENGRGDAEMYNRRGMAQFMLGRIEESIEDFDEAIELSPSAEPHHWQRGISYYYAERFADGRRQFESHQTVNPSDVENGVWHFLCAARETSVEAARAKMLPIQGDPRIPMAEIYELFRGKVEVDDVFAATKAGDPAEEVLRVRLFYAHLYVGLYFEALGDEAKTLEHIRLAAEDYAVGHYMWHVARVHLDRLTG